MGVPSFFRWLVKRYPSILSRVISEHNNSNSNNRTEDEKETEEAEVVNGHFDNLYLDLNGVIHSCSHSDSEEVEDKLGGLSDQQRFEMISKYIDYLVGLIKPTSLLYLAIDGVAPRAKMNQQRSRRFRSADVATKNKILSSSDSDSETHGSNDNVVSSGDDSSSSSSGSGSSDSRRKKSGSSSQGGERWDSNQITPGTPFMTELTTYLENAFQERVDHSSLYKNLKVLFSPCCSPGEGEHKIIAFIRAQRRDVNYNPNLSHCVYGGDADLILLGLGTHEPRFHILREGLPPPGQRSVARAPSKYGEFEMVNLGVLRAYLARDLIPESAKAVKNNVPASLLAAVSTQQEVKSPDLKPVPNASDVAICGSSSSSSVRAYHRLHILCNTVADAVLTELDLERVLDDWIVMSFFVGNDFIPSLPSLKIREGAISTLAHKYREQVLTKGYIVAEDRSVNLARVREIVADVAKNEANAFQRRKTDDDYFKRHVAPRLDREQGLPPRDESSIAEDEVRFHEAGYRERYYKAKMGIDVNSPEGSATLQQMLEAYQAGLLWIAEYYFHGCRSWLWYYPFHYAPLASDLATLATRKPQFCSDVHCYEYKFCAKHQFNLGEPFCPFAQLLAVLPPYSVNFLPQCLWPLVLDPSSPLASFYPTELDIDCEDPRLAWHAVVRLPFVSEALLLQHLQSRLALLNDEETSRNTNWNFGQDVILVGDSHPVACAIRDGVKCLNWRDHGLSADVVANASSMRVEEVSSSVDRNNNDNVQQHHATSANDTVVASSSQSQKSRKWRINAQKGCAREVLGEEGPRCSAVLLPGTSFAEFFLPPKEERERRPHNNNYSHRSSHKKDHKYNADEIILHTMKQLEGYFSQASLTTDVFLQSTLRNNNGWLPLTLVATFPRMKFLNNGDVSICLRAALDSNLLTVNAERTCVQPRAEIGGEETGIRNLRSYISKPQCLNEDAAHPIANVLSDAKENAMLKSSSDEQLLITVPFQQPVDISSIELRSLPDGSAPASIRVFLNSPHLDFNDAEEETVSPVQSFLLSQLHYEDNCAVLKPLNGRFLNVTCITLFVASNVGLQDVTIIAGLQFKGQLHAQGMSIAKAL